MKIIKSNKFNDTICINIFTDMKGKIMKNKIKFKINGWVYNDVKNIIDQYDYSTSVKNNLWLVFTYIYVCSNEDRDEPCQLKQIVFKDIVKHANNENQKTVVDFINCLKDNKIIVINNHYSNYKDNKFAKSYGLSFGYREYLLDIFSEEEIVELKVTNKTKKQWQILQKEDFFNILNEEICYKVKDENLIEELMKDNPYEEYEKNSIGYHQNATETQLIIRERMLYHFNFDEDKVKKHIEQLSDYYDELTSLKHFIKNTRIRSYSFKHGRFYLNGYSNVDKKFRDTFKYDDNKLIELKDIKSCFVLQTIILFNLSEQANKKQIEELIDVIVNKDIYLVIAYLIWGNDVNQDVKKFRNRAKDYVIRWFFMSNDGKKKCCGNNDLVKVRNYFKDNYPVYYKWLTSYYEIVDEKRNKSCISIDCEWLQNELVVNELAKKFVNYKIITLHDSLWISEDQYSEQLKKEVDQQWKNILEKFLEKNL